MLVKDSLEVTKMLVAFQENKSNGTVETVTITTNIPVPGILACDLLKLAPHLLPTLSSNQLLNIQ